MKEIEKESRTIEDRVWKRDDRAVCREVIEEAHGRKLRYYIKVDAYEFQSHAYAEVLGSGPQWMPLHHIPGELMNSYKMTSPYSSAPVRPRDFQEDLDTLQRVVDELLG